MIEVVNEMFRDRDWDFRIDDRVELRKLYNMGGKRYFINYGDDDVKSIGKEVSKLLVHDVDVLIIISTHVEKWIGYINRYDAEDRLVRKVEIFDPLFFTVNPTEHFYVPTHRKATDIERQTLSDQLSKYGNTIEANLAQLEIVDAMSRWYGFNVNDLIVIKRTYPIYEYPVYRVVSDIDYKEIGRKFNAIVL